jgi:hypothetical protein
MLILLVTVVTNIELFLSSCSDRCGSGTWYQVESFYEKKRLLSEMRAVQRESTNDSASARLRLKVAFLFLGRLHSASLAASASGR